MEVEAIKTLFVQAIEQKCACLEIPFPTPCSNSELSVIIDELIRVYQLQNIHHLEKGDYCIEYFEEKETRHAKR